MKCHFSACSVSGRDIGDIFYETEQYKSFSAQRPSSSPELEQSSDVKVSCLRKL